MVKRNANKLTPAIMVQGTGSNVGKSLVVAGLCRLFANKGLNVRPFKPQNMSNNAAVTCDGGEIGRAQALQALGARVPPSVHMNPVLLKPQNETGAQIIVQGKRFGSMRAKEYGKRKNELLTKVVESFDVVSTEADLVLVEGAGSPAEINLRKGDIANMGFAEAVNIPVILCADIDRGGVIASAVGTHAVIEEEERQRIKGFFINRFRGDTELFADGMLKIEKRTGWQGLGIIPWFADAGKFPAEDALGLAEGRGDGQLKVVVPVISRIANFDDLDPLRLEEDVSLTLVQPGTPLPGDADLVLLPGSKSTIRDLAFFREQGWDIDLEAHYRRGGRILGICGGYQMLGKLISDPGGFEGPPETVQGLGYLDVETTLTDKKSTVQARGTHVETGAQVEGYEIHLGKTKGKDCQNPMIVLSNNQPDGAMTANRQVAGSYIHGLFTGDAFRSKFLAQFGAQASLAYDTEIDVALDSLANHLDASLDIERIWQFAKSKNL